jgi:signal transduction histidine kinase
MGKVAGNWEEDAGITILQYVVFSYLSYIFVTGTGLFIMYFLKILNNMENEVAVFDGTDINERLAGRSLNLNKWSVKFDDSVVEKYYQHYVRENILPKTNLFFVTIFSVFAVVKATRLFVDDPNPYSFSFSTMPRSRIIETISALVHCAIFQWAALKTETNKGWEKCFHGGGCGQRCLPKYLGRSIKFRTIMIRDVLNLTRFILFAAPYLLQVPAVQLCIINGDFLPSSQCQHIYWAAHSRRRVTDNRMHIDFKKFLNNPKLEKMHHDWTDKKYEELRAFYDQNHTLHDTKGNGFEDFIYNQENNDRAMPYTPYSDEEITQRYRLLREIFVEQSVRPWSYARDVELLTVYTFTLLLGYTLSQMATWDAGCINPCNKKSLGFGFFVLINLWAFGWAVFLQATIPWTTLTEILIRPALYWICFIYFVYFIEHSRRESWSRSVQIEKLLHDKSKLHNLYQKKQERFVNDLAHNYGNMSSTVALCWNDALAANEKMMQARENGDCDQIFKMQKAVERSVQKAKTLVVLTQTVVLASVRHLRGDVVNQPTRVALGESLRNIPYFTSQYFRHTIQIDDDVPEFVYIDYSVFLTCIINLASNAQKYSKGTIILRASYTNRNVKIAVIDEGDGIPINQQGIIFTRGQGSRISVNGSLQGIRGEGIGLNSVATLITSVGGKYGVISPWRNGKGSNFWFELTDEFCKFNPKIANNVNASNNPVKCSDKYNNNARVENNTHTIAQKENCLDNNEELKFQSAEEKNTFFMSDDISLETKIRSSDNDGVATNVSLITIAKESMPYTFDHDDVKSFRMLIVEDNPLMVYAIKSKLGSYFRNIGVPATLYVVDFIDTSSMGMIALELMKSNYVFDAILLDQQLGVRDISKNYLWGTDVIIQYNDYLNSKSVFEPNKDQRLHLMSAAGSLSVLRSEVTSINSQDTDWLSPSPFSKPIQQRELDNFILLNYPRYKKGNAV